MKTIKTIIRKAAIKQPTAPRAFWALLAVLCLAPIQSTSAQTVARWKAHDTSRPKPPMVESAAKLPVPPPSDAIVLFDGSDLSKWRSRDGRPSKWVIKDDYMESVKGAGYIFARDSFGDVQLHVEFATPSNVQGKSQGRGNSGVFLMDLYEVQVLDSYDNPTYVDGQASAIYGQHPPLVNASRKPGEWQAYDIIFRRPRFNPDGGLATPARFTVLHNGVLVQGQRRGLGRDNLAAEFRISETRRPVATLVSGPRQPCPLPQRLVARAARVAAARSSGRTCATGDEPARENARPLYGHIRTGRVTLLYYHQARQSDVPQAFLPARVDRSGNALEGGIFPSMDRRQARV